MTDFDRWKQLIDEFGIGHDIASEYLPDGQKEIVLTAHEHRKVDGYFGFSAHFKFDADGRFMHVELWE